MQLYGLIGKQLSHSWSPAYFSQKIAALGIDAEYRLFEIEQADNLLEIIRNYPGLKGLNVTVPFKVDIMSWLDETDPAARAVGAVNTIRIDRKDERPYLTGYNTDTHGFEVSLLQLTGKTKPGAALILGSGGGARAVSYVLGRMDISHLLVSRSPEKPGEIGYEELSKDLFDTHQLIVNATPLGMYPATDGCPPIPYHYLTRSHFLFDLVYNPEETVFLKKGRRQGAATLNGLDMLHAQADASWEIWQAT